MKCLRAGLTLILVGSILGACSEPSDNSGNVKVFSVQPIQAMPGESIVLAGESFEPGMQVCFGDGMNMCTGVLVTSSNIGTAIVPAGSGTNLPVRACLVSI